MTATTMASSSLLESSDSDAHRAPHDTALGETTDPAGSQAGNDNSVVDPFTKVVLGSHNADQDTTTTAPPATSSPGNDNLAVVGHNKVVPGACSTYQDKGKTTARASSRARNDTAVVDADNKVAHRSCNTGNGKGKATAPASSSVGHDCAVADPHNKGVQDSPNADLDMDITGVSNVGTKVVPVPGKSDEDRWGEVACPTADPCTSPVTVNSTGNGSRARANDSTTPRAGHEAANLNHGANVPAEQPGDGANNDIAAGDGHDNTAQGPAVPTTRNGQPGPEVDGANPSAADDDYREIRALQQGSAQHKAKVLELYRRRLGSGNPKAALQLDACCVGYRACTYWGPEAPDVHIVRYLGRGGYGTVFLVADAVQKLWALKVFWAEDREDWESWDRESDALDELEEVAGVPFMAGAEPRGRFLYIQMDFINRGDLSELELGTEESLRAMVQILGTVHEAHAMGFVHHDIKPQNIFARSDGCYFLGDWGLATKAAGCEEAEWRCPGTVGFKPPELLQGLKHGPKVDVYGVAATVKLLVDGRPLGVWLAEAGWAGASEQRLRTIIEWMAHPDPDQRPTAAEAQGVLAAFVEMCYPTSDKSATPCAPSPQAGPSHANLADNPDSTMAAQFAVVPADVAPPPSEQPQLGAPADPASLVDPANPVDPSGPAHQLDLVAVILESTAQPLEALNQTHEANEPADTVPAEPQEISESVVDLGEPTTPVVDDSESPVLTVPTAAPTEVAEATPEPLNTINPTEPLQVAEASFEAVLEPLEAIAELPEGTNQLLEASAEQTMAVTEPLESIDEQLVANTEPVEDNQPAETLESPTQTLEAIANSTELAATEEEPLADAHPTEPLQVAIEQPVAIAGLSAATADLAQTAQTTEPAQGTDTLEIADPTTLEGTADSVQTAADAPELAAGQLQPAEQDQPADNGQDEQTDEPDQLAAPSVSSELTATDAPATAPTVNPAQGPSASTPGHSSTVAQAPVSAAPAGTAPQAPVSAAPVGTPAPTSVPTTTTAQGVSTAAPAQGSTLAPAPVSTAPAVIIAPAPDDDLLHDLVFTDYLDVLRQLEPGAVGGGLRVGTATHNSGGPSVQVGATLGQGGPSVQANGGNGNGNGNSAGVVSGGGGSAQGSASTTTTEGVGASSSSLYSLTHQIATNFVEEAVMIDAVSGCESYDVVRPKKRNVFKRAADRVRGAFRHLKCT